MSERFEEIIEQKVNEARDRQASAIDGFQRSAENEERINQLCRAALTGSGGDTLMDYIRSITVNVVEHPTASDAQLRDREGMRRLYGILDRRRKSKPK